MTTESNSLAVAVGTLIAYFLLLTPLIMMAWNVGLHNSGLVPNEISWWTALGLTCAVLVVRGMLSALRKP